MTLTVLTLVACGKINDVEYRVSTSVSGQEYSRRCIHLCSMRFHGLSHITVQSKCYCIAQAEINTLSTLHCNSPTVLEFQKSDLNCSVLYDLIH